MTAFAEFVLERLPPAPARVLEVGCGPEGGLVPALLEAGYDAVGVDPRAPAGEPFLQTTFQEAGAELGRFDAAVAGRVLHHVEPLGESLDLLARLAPLLLADEFAWDAIDGTAQAWYEQRHAELTRRGEEPDGPPLLDPWRERVEAALHPPDLLLAALRERYRELVLERGPYLYRWLGDDSEADERALVEAGSLPAIGWRWAGAGQ